MGSPAGQSVNGTAKGQPLVIVVMGVSGCGKSTVAGHIAHQLRDAGLDVHCKDGDELHPASNIEKMARGIPLDDQDRQPWLDALTDYAREKARQHGRCVIACSALKKRYRQTINSAGNVVYIYLVGSYELIASRMHQRTGHFMPDTLLDSQFATLEDPVGELNVLPVSIEHDPVSIARDAVESLSKHRYLCPIKPPSV